MGFIWRQYNESMIEHTVMPVTDITRSKKFYAAALKPLGYKQSYDFGDAIGYMEGGHTSFLIGKKKRVDEGHVAFLAKSKQAVAAFYKAALKNGGKDNGGPGFRTDYGENYYAAFVLDPDGNNIEACYFGAKAPKTRKTR